jgi:hypothetical protein
MLNGQTRVVAVLVSSTTTETATSFLTVTGTGATTLYQTFTQVSSFPTTTGTTYTTTGIVAVPVQILTTATQLRATTWVRGIGQGCAPPPGGCTTYTEWTTQVIAVTQTGVVIVASPSQVQGFVTSQYLTNLPTTVFSTSASTSSYATGQVLAITNTETFTSATESTPPAPSISDILMQNLSLLLVLLAVVLGVLGFRFGRRGGKGPSAVSAPTGFCASCGAAMGQEAQFCPKCGAKRLTG